MNTDARDQTVPPPPHLPAPDRRLFRGSAMSEDGGRALWPPSPLNSTAASAASSASAFFVISMSIHVLMIVTTSVGNLVVIVAILAVKRLKTPSNALIMNLALSDALVGLIVMPLALLNDAFEGRWVLGAFACDFWTTVDVLACTASILNFLAISLDRYMIIAHPFRYAGHRKIKTMIGACVCVWLASAAISMAPVFGWGLPSSNLPQCIVNQSFTYQMFATLLSFYIPLSLVLILYTHIYRIADQMARRERETAVGGASSVVYSLNTNNRTFMPDSGLPPAGGGRRRSLNGDRSDQSSDASEEIPLGEDPAATTKIPWCPAKKKKKERPSRKRRTARAMRTSVVARWKNAGYNQKAIITLGVILGCFTVCWLPFFVNAILKPTYKRYKGHDIGSPKWLDPFLLWMGYFSPLLNPIIYSLFNKEFRTPFREVLCCRCKGLRNRLNTHNYIAEFRQSSS